MRYAFLGFVFCSLVSWPLPGSAQPAKQAAAPALEPKQTLPTGKDYFTPRAGLANSRAHFLETKQGRVAFLGGSITAGKGWRDQVCEELKQRFPQTEFDFINAGISSLGSTPGAFRFSRDVLPRGPVQLLFVEAAVNDSTNGQTDLEQIRGMEGIVRHARSVNPKMDIVMLHFVDPDKMAEIRKKRTPAVIANHEKVAEHYKLPSIDLAREVTERIDAGEFTWEKDFRDLHPTPFGHKLYANTIRRLFAASWATPHTAGTKPTPYPLPDKPLDTGSYARGRLVELKHAALETGWTLHEKWQPQDKAGTRPGFVQVPVLEATKPGATLKLKFLGTAVGVFVASGPDTGSLEYRIDGKAWQKRELFTQWSPGLHLPWAQVLAADLPTGEHELELRIAEQAHEKSKGHAVRIVHFLVN